MSANITELVDSMSKMHIMGSKPSFSCEQRENLKESKQHYWHATLILDYVSLQNECCKTFTLIAWLIETWSS